MLEKLDDNKVFYYFEKISEVPRGSGHNEKISNYLVAFAKEHGLKYVQDEYLNVIVWKPASIGYESHPTVMLQGHMDMVCEKESDVEHNFQTQPLELQTEGDFVFAKGTTLGGDDGIALAYALAILSDDSLKHPPLEVVFTTDEETGMNGAIALDTSELKAEYLLNLDSEEEGIFLTSCAGGMTSVATFSIDRIKKQGTEIVIRVDGLQGGHSGTEIDKNRSNATLVLGRLLNELWEMEPYALVSISGGKKDNAIPREALAVLITENAENCFKAVEKISDMLKKELQWSEPSVCISSQIHDKKTVQVFSEENRKTLLFFLQQAPNGVQVMSSAIHGLVESSLNLGICNTTESEVVCSFSVRSSMASYKNYLGKKLQKLSEFCGGNYEKQSEYPAWEYRKDSKLRNCVCDVYEEMYGKMPKVEAIHAGLECGIFSDKMPSLDIVAMGPDIFDIHTPKERLSISSAKRVYDFLIRLLQRL